MDLEQLTKHQIILLTLLVSFVTSIATGIVTVSLMDQAPPSVVQTINRIVEHTVERVVPSDLAAAVTEKTVVIKEDDLTAQSIASAQKAVVRIVAANNPASLITRGIIVGNGIALTDRSTLAQSGYNNFEAILSTGERVPITVVSGTTSIALITIATTTPPAVTMADGGKLMLGQSVIRIGGTGTDKVGVGVISQLPGGDHKNLIEASVSSATPGSVLLTLFGELVGIITAESLSANPNGEFYSVTSVPQT